MAVYRVSVSVMYLDPTDPTESTGTVGGNANTGGSHVWGEDVICLCKEDKKHVSNDGDFLGIGDFSPLNGLLNQVWRFKIW